MVFNSEEQQNHFWMNGCGYRKRLSKFFNRYLCFSSILTEI
ncbi:MAG: hypothetical protein ACLU30_07185 [Odoribacter splanchnicus]